MTPLLWMCVILMVMVVCGMVFLFMVSDDVLICMLKYYFPLMNDVDVKRFDAGLPFVVSGLAVGHIFVQNTTFTLSCSINVTWGYRVVVPIQFLRMWRLCPYSAWQALAPKLSLWMWLVCEMSIFQTPRFNLMRGSLFYNRQVSKNLSN